LKISSKYFLISACLFVFTLKLFPQSNSRLQESRVQKLESSIEKITNDPFFEQTSIAISIFDLTDSIPLFSKNEKLLLRPASNMKLLTSAAALINLGENYFFKTDLFHSGVIENNILYGDIYVVGGFDPDFSMTDLDSFVTVIKSLGIQEISGGIYGDISKKDSLFWGKGWMWDDDPEPSAPYLSALNINDNTVEVFVNGADVGSSADYKLFPQTNYVQVINNSITVSSNFSEDFYVKRDWVNQRNTIIIEGKVRKSFIVDSSDHQTKLNLLQPEKYFITLLKERLELNGILIDKPIGIKNKPINSVYLTSLTRSIDSVLVDLNKVSDNLNAEMLIYAMAFKDSGAPASSINGLAAVKRLIDSIGFNSGEYSLADGSGVSHYNLISSELILELLKYMYYYRNDLFDLFYNSLPVGGVDGTLKNRMKNTGVYKDVHAKTGTLNGVSNLSGYVTAKNGHLIAFSILIQNFVDEYSKARKIQDEICEILAESN